MAQPTSQVGMASGHTGEYFYYPNGSGLWDAKNGAMLTKTGSGTVDSTGDVGQLVANGNGSTYYDMGADLALTAPWTVSFKVKRTSATGDAGMVIGRRDGTAQNYFWIRASEVRAFNATVLTSGSDSWHTYTYVKNSDGTSVLYKDGTQIATPGFATSGTVRYILSGYTSDTYALNGALEYLHIIPGVAKNSTEVSAMVSDPYSVLASGGTSISCATGTASATGYAASIAAATVIACSLGTGDASGYQATVQTGSNTTISCNLGTASALGYTAGVAVSGTGYLTTEEFKNNTGTLLTSQTVNKVWLIDFASSPDFSNVVTNATTGVLDLASVSITPGHSYLVVSADSTGAIVGVQKVLAT